jgi:hypothetical protein
MKFNYLLLILSFLCFSCKKESSKISLNQKIQNEIFINKKGTTIKSRFLVPNGFKRIETSKNTFEYYLQNFKLKPHLSKVHLYNNKLKFRQDVHIAILDIDVGKRDLQQCADATMRLKSEFLYQQKRYNDIHFNFTNGFKASYSKWRNGYRIKVNGNKVNWYKTNQNSTSYLAFKKYLIQVFSYAGTRSLEQEMQNINIEDMKIGDVFIQGGSPGHAIIIVDIAKNDTETLFLLAQSYMPAQEIHVLKNFNNSNKSPWYSSKNLEDLDTPEWRFNKANLKRFP